MKLNFSLNLLFREQEVAHIICGMVLADMASTVILTIQRMPLMLSSMHPKSVRIVLRNLLTTIQQ
jgi:hypothetical protein